MNSILFFRVNDGFCDEDLLTEECCFDLGDCHSMEYINTCISQCHVPGLNSIDIRHYLLNGICDKPLNQTNCCFDNGECLAVQFDCTSCPYQTKKVFFIGYLLGSCILE